VFQDVPLNSHLKPELVVSWETLVQFMGPGANMAWKWDDFFNYLLLHSECDYKAFESKLPDYIEARIGPENLLGSGVSYHLQPLRSIHLHSDFMFEAEANGNAGSVYALNIIAAFLLLIAWINYINLAGARTLERAREVGMRKVNGALRRHVLLQFLFESFLLNVFAMMLAFMLVELLHPAFNMLNGTQLDYFLSNNQGFWISVLLIFLLGTAISGLYPALILSSFKPIAVIRGISGLKVGGLSMRRVLVIFQFICSLLLIAGTLTVYFQISYMKNHDLGVDLEDVLVLVGPRIHDSTYTETYSSFKSELIQNPDIKMLTASFEVPGRKPYWNSAGIRLLSEGQNKAKQYRILGIDFDFVDFYGLTILEGRNFSEKFGNNSRTVLLNESTVEQMGFPNPGLAIGVPIFFRGDTFEIVGVVRNYHQEGLKVDFDPLIFRFFRSPSSFYSLKYNGLKTREVLSFVKDQWEQFFPLNPFEYFFLEDYYQEQYANEMSFGKMFALFAFLAILIASLGLFGLSSYTTSQRTREIGLRKVLGASPGNTIILLLRYFFIQLLIALPIGLGIGYLLMKDWLKDFAYRIGIGWWFFLIPALMILLISFLTVAGQVLRTASLSPANSLRYE